MSIDVVLVSYNAEAFIKQALESIYIQRVKPELEVRIIVSDDCSTDKTLFIIRSLESESPFPFIYVQHDKNLGITRNYQLTFSKCTGDYVAVLEGDDYWCSPYHLQSHVDFLVEHRECVMSVNKNLIYNQNIQFESTKLEMINDTQYQLIALEDLLVWNHIVNFSSVVYRGNALQKINPSMWDVEVKNVDDWLVALELAQYGYVGKLNQYTTIYRKHSSNTYGTIDSTSFTHDVIHRIEVYDRYFGYKYHVAFTKHLKANMDVLRYYRDANLYNKMPKLVWWMFIAIRRSISIIKGIPKFFIPPCMMVKIKRHL